MIFFLIYINNLLTETKFSAKVQHGNEGFLYE